VKRRRSVRDEVLKEYDAVPMRHSDPHLESLLRAIFLEDALGVVVPEQHLAPGGLADPRSLLEQLDPR
jgi:hypothetical protein